MARQAGILYTGGFYPELETALARHVAALKRDKPLRPVTLCAANRLLGQYLSRRLAETGAGHLNLRATTLNGLTEELARPALERRGLKPLPEQADLVLIESLLAEHRSHVRYFNAVADLGGFAQALLSTFTDLFEAGLDADGFRDAATRAQRADRAKLRELADLYAAYREALKTRNYCDRPMLDALAREALSEQPEPFHPRDLILYGFYDFNARQRTLIAKLIDASCTAVFLPYRPLRAYAFAEPTLAWLRSLGLEERPAAAPLNGLPAGLRRLREADLFALDTPPAAAPNEAEGITVLSAPNEAAEAAEIARELYAPADETAPWEQGVITRQPRAYAAIWRNLLPRADRSAWRQGGRPLAETPAARGLRLLGRTLETDFERVATLELLTCAALDRAALLGDFAPDADPEAWERLSIKLGIVDGRDAWLEKLEHYCRSAQQNADGEPDRAAEALLLALRTLTDAVGAIGVRGGWRDYAETFAAIGERLFVPGAEGRAETLAALAALVELDGAAPRTTLAKFLAVARRALEERALPAGRYERDGPALCELAAARGVSWRRVFVPGLCDKSFPRVVRQDPILLDSERRALNEALSANEEKTAPPRLNLPLRARDEERLLFQLAAEAARERLVLSFPRFDAGGTERAPSAFLRALTGHFAGSAASAAPETFPHFTRIGLAQFHSAEPERALDEAEYDLARRAQLTPDSRAAGYLTTVDAGMTDSARWAAARRARALTPYDGLLADAESGELLRRGHSPFAAEMSPTRLENYASCPFAYFMGHVLGLSLEEAPEDIETLSPLDRGSLLHAIYEEFYQQLKAAGRLPLKPAATPELQELILEIARRHFERLERARRCGWPGVWEAERARLERDLREFAAIEAATAGDWAPEHLETPFGRLRHLERETEDAGYPAVALPVGGMERTVRFHGVIDRIDRAARAFRIIDYKTGKRDGGKEVLGFSQGRKLQLPVYLLAGRAIAAEGGDVESAGYYFSTRRGGFEHSVMQAADLDELEPQLRQVVELLCSGIEAGHFFHVPNAGCQYCEFQGPCGAARDERYRRKERAPARLNFDRLHEFDPPRRAR